MRRSLYHSIVVGFTLLALLAVAAPLRADTEFGVRGGAYTDLHKGFVGVELLHRISGNWFINPNYEYVFRDNGDFSTLNLDFHYDLVNTSAYSFWLGAGPAIVFDNPPGRAGSKTDFGGNILAGIGFPMGEVEPYVQGKVLIYSGKSEGVVGIGIRF